MWDKVTVVFDFYFFLFHNKVLLLRVQVSSLVLNTHTESYLRRSTSTHGFRAAVGAGQKRKVHDKGTVGFTVWPTSSSHYWAMLHTNNQETFCLSKQVCEENRSKSFWGWIMCVCKSEPSSFRSHRVKNNFIADHVLEGGIYFPGWGSTGWVCVHAFVHVRVCFCGSGRSALTSHTNTLFSGPVLMLSVLSCAPDELLDVTWLHECYEWLPGWDAQPRGESSHISGNEWQWERRRVGLHPIMLALAATQCCGLHAPQRK